MSIREHFTLSGAAIAAALLDEELEAAAAHAADTMAQCLIADGKILLAGNGGSAAGAQHIAGELMGNLNFPRPALPAIALTADSAVLTALANDFGYDWAIARQIEALGMIGDIFIGLSTSGNSSNIIQGLKRARQLGLTTIGMTGRSGGAMLPLCDICLRVPSHRTSLIQEVHLVVAHAICAQVEAALFSPVENIASPPHGADPARGSSPAA
jgi:D-sedoheptulose 7-phosphate isomerase